VSKKQWSSSPPWCASRQYRIYSDNALDTLGRLSIAKEFENIVVRANPDGSLVRVRDVARVELGAQSSDTFSRFNGAPAASPDAVDPLDDYCDELASRTFRTLAGVKRAHARCDHLHRAAPL
jgi:Cu/Ag efflux pump CusA